MDCEATYLLITPLLIRAPSGTLSYDGLPATTGDVLERAESIFGNGRLRPRHATDSTCPRTSQKSETCA